MRKDLGMSPAKLAVQVGHGTDFIHKDKDENSFFEDWKNKENDRRKIVLEVKSEAKLRDLADLLRHKGIPFCKIYDSGHTEFNEKTLTGLIIYPIDENNLPDKIKRMRLYL